MMKFQSQFINTKKIAKTVPMDYSDPDSMYQIVDFNNIDVILIRGPFSKDGAQSITDMLNACYGMGYEKAQSEAIVAIGNL